MNKRKTKIIKTMKCYEDKKGEGKITQPPEKYSELEPYIAFFQGNSRKDVKPAALFVFMRD